jgi:PAS domain S-box-containing protein
MRLNRDLESLVEKRTRELSLSEKKYRGIFEGSMDMIFVLDNQWRFQDINQAGLDTLGYDSPDDLVPSVSMAQVFVSSSDFDALVEELGSAGSIRDRECRLRQKSGSEIFILLSITVTRDEPGQIRGYEGIAKDITARRRMERQLQQADRLASLGQTAAGIAHELNTPLGVILGYSQLLLRSCQEQEQTSSDLRIIEKQTNTCRRIVHDLLKFSRDTKTEKASIDLSTCLGEAISLLAHQFEKEGVTVDAQFGSDLPRLLADGEKLKQVLVNLLVNARQAISESGRITVTCGVDPEEDSIRISVSDNGSGISPDIVDKIFDPFFTTKSVGEGTGLGLSVSYGIIRDHDGRIEVQSDEGVGTTFTIFLPLADESRDGTGR